MSKLGYISKLQQLYYINKQRCNDAVVTENMTECLVCTYVVISRFIKTELYILPLRSIRSKSLFCSFKGVAPSLWKVFWNSSKDKGYIAKDITYQCSTISMQGPMLNKNLDNVKFTYTAAMSITEMLSSGMNKLPRYGISLKRWIDNVA